MMFLFENIMGKHTNYIEVPSMGVRFVGDSA